MNQHMAPEQRESTIWSKLEAEKQRRHDIRVRHSVGNRSIPPRSRSFDSTLIKPPSTTTKPSMAGEKNNKGSPPTSISEEFQLSSAPNYPSRILSDAPIIDAPCSASTAGSEDISHHENRRKDRVKSVKTSHNRMPHYQSKHYQETDKEGQHHKAKTGGTKKKSSTGGSKGTHDDHPKTPVIVATQSRVADSTASQDSSLLTSSEEISDAFLPPAPDLTKSPVVSPRPTISSLNSAGTADTSLSNSPSGSNGGVEKPPLRRKLKKQQDNSKSTSASTSAAGDAGLSLGQHHDSESNHEKLQETETKSAHSNRTGRSQRSGPVYGSTRYIDADKVQKTESWFYMAAFLMFATTTAGLSCVILLVFGALGPQISDDERLQNQVAYLSEDTVVFEDPTSAQYRAIDWMINMDESKIDWEKDTIRRESRYALAVLYFATGYGAGNSWGKALEFLSKNHECEWNDNTGLDGQGVGCMADETLVSLTIDGNGLRGKLPVELSGLSNLEILHLSSNVLTGTIPAFTFQNLKEIRLDENRLGGPFPSSFSQFTTLRILNVTSNILSSTLPEDLGGLTNLESLKMGSNDMTGSISEYFGELVQLRELDLSKNAFSGSIVMIQNFPSLERLDLSSNRFLGTIPINLGGLSNLNFVSLANNGIEGTIPSTIGFMPSLQLFDASNNILSGSFPWSFFSSNENQLTQLILAKNALSGSIPTSDIFRFNRLEVVDFGRNLLTGNFPNGFGSMGNLRMLDFSANKFDGTLPADLGFAESLVSLNLAGNQLFGAIPATFGRLDNLTRLNLQGNQLSGTVPQPLADLPLIERIGLHNNDLSGNINFLCSIDPSPIISADCGGNNPLVICRCCDVCLDR